MSKKKSNRHKKKVVKEGLRALKNKPGWDVDAYRNRDPQQGLRQLEQSMRGHRTYEDAQSCTDCEAIRQDSDDETALCDRHLAEAMGLDPGD